MSKTLDFISLEKWATDSIFLKEYYLSDFKGGLRKSCDILEDNLWDNGIFFQGDRCDDLGMNNDLIDTDARVSKCLKILLELIFLSERSPTLDGIP